MAYLDEPEHDDRRRDDRDPDGRRRPTQPARPAWDAATYGTADDLRRARQQPPPGRYGDGTSASSPYSDNAVETYPPSPYSPDPYPAEPYSPDPYPAEPYPSDSYPSDSYPSDLYAHPADFRSADPAVEQYPVEPPPRFDRPPPAGPYAVDSYPGAAPEHRDDPAVDPESRSGRNLPAAIGVGVLLGGAVLGSLFFWRPAFLGVVAIAVGVGIWELVRAIRHNGVNPPLVPLVAGGGLMTGLAWWGHADALTFGLMVTVLAVMVWRLGDGAGGYGRDVTAATLVAVYVPFLGGFAALLASAPEDGDLRVLVTLAGVVLSDTGGYISGSVFGRHPMAPSVSPKKSWEGLAGSLVATALGSAILLHFLFDVSLWWGAVFGVAVSAAAVLGDLGESLVKRDLGVKDMGTLLPGHGGLMDRLDSIVFAAPTAYFVLVLLAPPL